MGAKVHKGQVGAVPQKRGPSVAIAWVHPGQVSAFFADSLLGTLLWDWTAGDRPPMVRNLLREWSSANVSSSRNTVTARFLDENAELVEAGRPPIEWLLWVDADMQWEPEAIGQLVESADPKARPIMGGLCFGLFEGAPAPTIWHGLDGDEGFRLVRLISDFPRDQVVPCLATGAAFLLIHRSVLEAMRAREYNRAFPFFQETELAGEPVGEDLTFCLRAGLLGFPVHVNTSVRVGHHKSDLLTESRFDDVRLLAAAKGEGPTP